MNATQACSNDNCSARLPVGSMICSVCGTPQYSFTVPIPSTSPPTDPSRTSPDYSETPANEPWRCPIDGSLVVGDVCVADGSRRPITDPSANPLHLILPNGESLDLAYGEAIELGRHSPHPQVAEALESHAGVSRRHATIRWENESVVVVDHGSMNGTRVNGQQVEGTARVPAGDLRTVHLGSFAVINVRRRS